jgi:hypothetical protein
MHAVAVRTLINPRMLLIEMLRKRKRTNKRNQARGTRRRALLFLRAIYKVERGGNKFPKRGIVLAFLYVELGNLDKATQFYPSINSALPFLECCIPFEPSLFQLCAAQLFHSRPSFSFRSHTWTLLPSFVTTPSSVILGRRQLMYTIDNLYTSSDERKLLRARVSSTNPPACTHENLIFSCA